MADQWNAQKTAKQIELREALLALESGLTDFKVRLCRCAKDALPATIFDPHSGEMITGKKAWDRAIETIGQIEYGDTQEPREVIVLPGVLGVSEDILEQARTLNAAKNWFREAYQSVNTESSQIAGGDDPTKQPEAKRILQKMGRARLHVKQAYRQIVFIEERPDRIGFSWTRTKKVERITRERAMRMAERFGDTPAVAEAKRRLLMIPEGEPLARVQQPHPHLRANLTWKNSLPKSGAKNIQRRAALPILLPCDSSQILPPISPFYGFLEKENVTRRKRSDVRVEDEPFVSLIHVHRYLPDYRK